MIFVTSLMKRDELRALNLMRFSQVLSRGTGRGKRESKILIWLADVTGNGEDSL